LILPCLDISRSTIDASCPVYYKLPETVGTVQHGHWRPGSSCLLCENHWLSYGRCFI